MKMGRRRFLTALAGGPLVATGCLQSKTQERSITMEPSNHVSFVGGSAGTWRVLSVKAVRGPSLAEVPRIDVKEGGPRSPAPDGGWTLRGVVSHLRYTTGPERQRLVAAQAGLGRAEATLAALIPIKKSEAWWSLAQDERRRIFEEQSHHIEKSMKYLPAVSRRLHHSREIGEPFDFLTWFEYAPKDAGRFEELVGHLRSTEEWKYVIREIDLRLVRD